MPKDLYLCQSMEDLEKMSKIPDLFKQKPVNIICRSIGTVNTQANKALEENDEEMAYVMLMKYFNLIEFVRKAKDFKKEEQFIRKILGTNSDIRARMDQLQVIKNSLLKRYEEKRRKNQMGSISANNNNLQDNIVAKLPAESMLEKPSELNTSMGLHNSIKPDELYKLINDPQITSLVMDCRKSDEFEASHLIYKNLLNVPEQIIKKGLSAGTLYQQLPTHVHPMWSKRCIADRVILIDWHSKAANSNLDVPIWILRDILLNWDPDVKYSNSIQIVDGGYEMFMLSYPMITSNPKFKPEISIVESYESIDDIEYPSLSDIKMRKDTPLKDVTNRSRPSIDRSSKLAAEKTYKDKWKTPEEIIKEKEQLIDRALQKEKEALKLEADLEQTMREEPNEDETKRREWYEKQTELQYKIMQYDNERDDNITQREELEEELGSIAVDEIPNIDKTVTQRIREKEHEQQLLELARKRKNEENERLMIAREKEKKRSLKIQEDEIPTKPKQPMIDRSVKPSLPPLIYPSMVTQRNFAPEYGIVRPGLTGLKNLGNTCYMNSIIQCLSNVVELRKYFCTGHYKKHLNRKSRTRGEISEEFAAVCSELWSGKCRSISPQNFRHVFGQYKKEFAGYEQQDSHEFLTILIDYLHSELEIQSDINPSTGLKASEQAWHDFLKNKQSFVMKQFYGQTRSTVKCRVCQHESATYEGFSNLSFELPQHSRQSDLKECMDMYFDGEKISGWFCPLCKKERDAIKKLDISKVPPVLAVHLKRFEFDLDTSMRTCKKIQNYIRFPINQFDISDYVTLSARRGKNPSHYNLCAVSNHYGTVDRGHYTAFCKNVDTNCWYKFDDNCVSPIDKSAVVTSAAYILFYSNL